MKPGDHFSMDIRYNVRVFPPPSFTPGTREPGVWKWSPIREDEEDRLP